MNLFDDNNYLTLELFESGWKACLCLYQDKYPLIALGQTKSEAIGNWFLLLLK